MDNYNNKKNLVRPDGIQYHTTPGAPTKHDQYHSHEPPPFLSKKRDYKHDDTEDVHKINKPMLSDREKYI